MSSLHQWCTQKTKSIIYRQDFQQHLTMTMNLSLELYRVMISSLLIVFVPQQCDDHVCVFMENNASRNQMSYIALVINYITMISLLIMYICEIRREEKLIKVLEVNNTISTDNESVGKCLELLDTAKKEKIFSIDLYYQITSYIAIAIYVINIVVSGVALQQTSLGNQTTIIFLTNLLFMINKFSNVYIIINTDKNIFFSAYLNTKVQFNDIDPRELNKIEKRQSIQQYVYNIEKTRGFCLIEKPKINFLNTGGFIIDMSSSESDPEFTEKEEL